MNRVDWQGAGGQVRSGARRSDCAFGQHTSLWWSRIGSAGGGGQDVWFGRVVGRRSEQYCLGAAVGGWKVMRKRLAVMVGTLLKVELEGSKASVDVCAGSNLEEILVEAVVERGAGTDEWLEVSAEEGKVGLRRGKEVGMVSLKATIPERWCSVAVEGGEGDVYIEKVREGSVEVRTRGGNVEFGEVKASSAVVETGGGQFKAKLLYAISDVKSGGGDIGIGRAFGSEMRLESGGGKVKVTTLYGDDVRIWSGGGEIELGHGQAWKMLDVRSDGGAASIRGFEGKARICSKGGNVEVQLHEQAKEVDIECGDGNVKLYLSEKLSSKVEYRGGSGSGSGSESGVCMHDGSVYKVVAGQECGYLTLPVDADEEDAEPGRGRGRGRGRGIAASHCEVTVVCSGVVQVKKRSWAEGVVDDTYTHHSLHPNRGFT